MRLERLEINGFKSFSDRSELAFDKGVTAIVGPNGCGKSNVADAITWVMGEQSAKSLRGERMEDVIFNGSDARKPTAAAEVRLRFSGVTSSPAAQALDGNGNGHAANGNGNGAGHAASHNGNGGNGHSAVEGNGHAVVSGNGHAAADGNGSNGNGHHPTYVAPVHDERSEEAEAARIAEEVIESVVREIEVTRRLYRSGDSEYLIDGRVCRLRDVHELLMDTGLGAKAYAIIEQGKIGLILSTRPTDRRQLIEEAAGITKYKSRRHAAALKLEAAQQNLTRIEDIVFEVEKQRGTLKRQATRARRYQKLRDELRRWEKVLLARKYRQLAETIESARGRLGEAREREAAASAHVAELEASWARLRIELAEAETGAAQSRENAHARELTINRDQQQLGFDREQIQALEGRTAAVAAEIQVLEQRREPAALLVRDKRSAAADASARRDEASEELTRDSGAYESAHREIEGLEADVEGARSEVFSALNSATALRHALEHAAAARERVAETLTKLDVELEDVRIESEHVGAARAAAGELMRKVQDALEATRIARSARESELASARIEHEWRSRSVRAREHELAGLEARLRSLEELEAARAGFGDAARAVLAHANGQVGQRGAVADYLEVESGYERAVEACLGELLQHVVVEREDQAAAGFALVRREGVGRCGFVIAGSAAAESPEAHGGFTDIQDSSAHVAVPDGAVRLSSVVRVNGPFASVIRAACGEAWIADAYERAAGLSVVAPVPIATRAGDVFRGPHVVSGGGPDEARGILETKREIRELRERVDREHKALAALIEETAGFEATILLASTGIAALQAEHHKQEKAMVGHDAQLQHASNETIRLARKGEQLIRERRQAEEERLALDRRQEEAHASIARLEHEQRSSDERLTAAQRRLFEARESAEDLSRRAAEAGAAHAALVERASALDAEVQRLEESNAEMENRLQALTGELEQARTRADELRAAVELSVARLDADIRALDSLKEEVRLADDAVTVLRRNVDERETVVRDARVALESVRGLVAELDVARATAEADLSHLAQSSLDSVQMNLDEVTEEVARLEREGNATPDRRVILAEEPDEPGDEEDGHAVSTPAGDGSLADLALPDAAVVAAQQKALSAEEAITALRAKIDRLGPVNMMAIEQFEELETRHTFLSTQRKDLVDSIEQTSEAIKRIDETTRQRFAEAFLAINRNFQETFSTLFGGGRAGLALLDESDPLESGIEIIAQPPGKRLQSVQLLSGGEKALTAIALMFGLFKYKPSPFCLLDEIDAPLDDANIGRFVEMLRGMQQHTQFILITHNRKTMEIADRLYGVTMEEPGVSKLISVQLH
jgi:chromosome segregation protein